MKIKYQGKLLIKLKYYCILKRNCINNSNNMIRKISINLIDGKIMTLIKTIYVHMKNVENIMAVKFQ